MSTHYNCNRINNLYSIMNVNKIISFSIILIIISFSFLGLIQLPENIDKSFSLIKMVMPYPGKTVFVINRFLKHNPLDHAARTRQTAAENKRQKNKFSALLFYVLSSILVCQEKNFLLFILILTMLAVAKYTDKRKFFNYYKDIFIPPDIKYYSRWPLKFITPIEKCIQYLADKYDINPINLYGRAAYALKKPALCFNLNGVRVFFMQKRA